MKIETRERRLNTNRKACQRCRSRKIRCDRQLPRCTHCEHANTECCTADISSGQKVPADYIPRLEMRVWELENRLLSHQYWRSGPRNIVKTASYWGGTSGISFWHAVSSKLQNYFGKNEHESSLLTSEFLGPMMGAPSQSFEEEPIGEPISFSLPPKNAAEMHLKKYFEVENTYIPIFYREEFINTYFEPTYGPLSPNLPIASEYTDLALPRRHGGDPPPSTIYFDYKGRDLNEIPSASVQEQRILYFILQMMAISTTSMLEDPKLSIKFHQQAMYYYGTVVRSPNRLEALKAILMLGVYSLARPARQSLWHVSGMAIQLFTELGLHNEDSTTWADYTDPLNKDEARRLFWSIYILDRQISMTTGRPTRLSDDFINVRAFALADDSLLVKGADPSRLPTFPSYKNVAQSLISLLQIQHKIKKNLYDLPDASKLSYECLLKVESELEFELDNWSQGMPRDKRVTNFEFRPLHLEIKYHITRILLARAQIMTSRSVRGQMEKMLNAGLSIMRNFCEIQELKATSFSWILVNSIFIAVTASLYAASHIVLAHTYRFDMLFNIERLIDGCLDLLLILRKTCQIAGYSYQSLKSMKENVLEMIRRRAASSTQTINNNIVEQHEYQRPDIAPEMIIPNDSIFASIDMTKSMEPPVRCDIMEQGNIIDSAPLEGDKFVVDDIEKSMDLEQFFLHPSVIGANSCYGFEFSSFSNYETDL